jgi:hypothetical protein
MPERVLTTQNLKPETYPGGGPVMKTVLPPKTTSRRCVARRLIVAVLVTAPLVAAVTPTALMTADGATYTASAASIAAASIEECGDYAPTGGAGVYNITTSRQVPHRPPDGPQVLEWALDQHPL